MKKLLIISSLVLFYFAVVMFGLLQTSTAILGSFVSKGIYSLDYTIYVFVFIVLAFLATLFYLALAGLNKDMPRYIAKAGSILCAVLNAYVLGIIWALNAENSNWYASSPFFQQSSNFYMAVVITTSLFGMGLYYTYRNYKPQE